MGEKEVQRYHSLDTHLLKGLDGRGADDLCKSNWDISLTKMQKLQRYRSVDDLLKGLEDRVIEDRLSESRRDLTLTMIKGGIHHECAEDKGHKAKDNEDGL